MLGRDLSTWAKMLPGILCFVLILGALCAMAAGSMAHGAESGYLAAPVAVVDEDGTAESKFAVSLIRNQDFAAPLAIVRCSEKAAQRGIRDGTFSAAVYLPAGYLGDISVGNRSEARIILSDSAALHGSIVRMLAVYGEELLSAGQFGVFAGEDLIWQEYPERFDEYLTQVNLLYLRQAMTDRWFVREELAYGGTGVTAGVWYALAYAALFCQLVMLAFLPFRRDLRAGILRRLRSAGINDGLFLASKVLFAWLTVLLTTAAVWLGLPFGWQALGILAFAALTAAAWGIGCAVCLSEAGAVGLCCAVAGVGLFLAGGIVPRAELPTLAARLGEFLPGTILARMGAAAFGAPLPGLTAVFAGLWTALPLAAALLRLRRIRKGDGL